MRSYGSICDGILAEKKDRFKKVNLYCLDESRFGLHTHTGRMLTARGVKPIAVSQQAFESTWLFGAFSPIDGKRLLIEADGCDSDFFQIFMDELSKTDSEELMLILLDNASFHKTGKLKIPDNTAYFVHSTSIALIYIPPYSPELNPAEKMWQRFKRAFTNKPFTSMKNVRDFLTEQVNLLTEDVVISTCAYEWIVLWNNWTV